MSAKFDRFRDELITLCQKHHVQLSTSMYDSMQAHDWDGLEDVIYGGIDDETKQDQETAQP